MSPDGRYVCKTIVTPAGRRFTERVRLFDQARWRRCSSDAGVDGPPALRRLRRRADQARLSPHHPGRAGSHDASASSPRRSDTRLVASGAARRAVCDPSLRDAFLPSPAREAALARLAEPGALAVTTGQQPGLFTGPLYTVHKALSAAALAPGAGATVGRARWCRSSGSRATITTSPRRATRRGSARTAPSRPRRCRRGHPMRRSRRCTASRSARVSRAALDALGASLPPSEFRDATLDWLGAALPAGGDRRRRPSPARMAELLAPSGVVVLRQHPSGGQARRPHRSSCRALEQARERSMPTSTGRPRRLATTARTSGVTVGDGAALVMLEGAQGRDRLVAADGAVRHPARQGAVQPRRPCQDRGSASRRGSRPTCCFGRWSRARCCLPSPISAGRASCATWPSRRRSTTGSASSASARCPAGRACMVEPRVDRVLEKFGVDARGAAGPARRARGAAGAVPAARRGAGGARRDPGRARTRATARWSRARARSIPTLARPIQGARHQALAGTQEIEKKLVQHLKRRQETELGQIGRARTAVLPGGKPQERVLTRGARSSRAMGRRCSTSSRDAIEAWYARRP